MSKRLVLFFVAVCVFSLTLCAFGFNVMAETKAQKPDSTVNVTSSVDGSVIARFETMLNNNFVYNEDFESDKAIIENSILSLVNHIENGQIDMALTLNFIANMYGRQVDPNAAVYEFLPADEGKFAVVPKGFSVYRHNNLTVEEIDGGFSVTSEMTVDAHDTIGSKVLVKSIFVPNEGSTFGYNLIKSEYVVSGYDI